MSAIPEPYEASDNHAPAMDGGKRRRSRRHHKRSAKKSHKKRSAKKSRKSRKSRRSRKH